MGTSTTEGGADTPHSSSGGDSITSSSGGGGGSSQLLQQQQQQQQLGETLVLSATDNLGNNLDNLNNDDDDTEAEANTSTSSATTSNSVATALFNVTLLDSVNSQKPSGVGCSQVGGTLAANLQTDPDTDTDGQGLTDLTSTLIPFEKTTLHGKHAVSATDQYNSNLRDGADAFPETTTKPKETLAQILANACKAQNELVSTAVSSVPSSTQIHSTDTVTHPVIVTFSRGPAANDAPKNFNIDAVLSAVNAGLVLPERVPSQHDQLVMLGAVASSSCGGAANFLTAALAASLPLSAVTSGLSSTNTSLSPGNVPLSPALLEAAAHTDRQFMLQIQPHHHPMLVQLHYLYQLISRDPNYDPDKWTYVLDVHHPALSQMNTADMGASTCSAFPNIASNLPPQPSYFLSLYPTLFNSLSMTKTITLRRSISSLFRGFKAMAPPPVGLLHRITSPASVSPSTAHKLSQEQGLIASGRVSPSASAALGARDEDTVSVAPVSHATAATPKEAASMLLIGNHKLTKSLETPSSSVTVPHRGEYTNRISTVLLLPMIQHVVRKSPELGEKLLDGLMEVISSLDQKVLSEEPSYIFEILRDFLSTMLVSPSTPSATRFQVLNAFTALAGTCKSASFWLDIVYAILLPSSSILFPLEQVPLPEVSNQWDMRQSLQKLRSYEREVLLGVPVDSRASFFCARNTVAERSGVVTAKDKTKDSEKHPVTSFAVDGVFVYMISSEDIQKFGTGIKGYSPQGHLLQLRKRKAPDTASQLPSVVNDATKKKADAVKVPVPWIVFANGVLVCGDSYSLKAEARNLESLNILFAGELECPEYPHSSDLRWHLASGVSGNSRQFLAISVGTLRYAIGSSEPLKSACVDFFDVNVGEQKFVWKRRVTLRISDQTQSRVGSLSKIVSAFSNGHYLCLSLGAEIRREYNVLPYLTYDLRDGSEMRVKFTDDYATATHRSWINHLLCYDCKNNFIWACESNQLFIFNNFGSPPSASLFQSLERFQSFSARKILDQPEYNLSAASSSGNGMTAEVLLVNILGNLDRLSEGFWTPSVRSNNSRVRVNGVDVSSEQSKDKKVQSLLTDKEPFVIDLGGCKIFKCLCHVLDLLLESDYPRSMMSQFSWEYAVLAVLRLIKVNIYRLVRLGMDSKTTGLGFEDLWGEERNDTSAPCATVRQQLKSLLLKAAVGWSYFESGGSEEMLSELPAQSLSDIEKSMCIEAAESLVIGFGGVWYPDVTVQKRVLRNMIVLQTFVLKLLESTNGTLEHPVVKMMRHYSDTMFTHIVAYCETFQFQIFPALMPPLDAAVVSLPVQDTTSHSPQWVLGPWQSYSQDASNLAQLFIQLCQAEGLLLIQKLVQAFQSGTVPTDARKYSPGDQLYHAQNANMSSSDNLAMLEKKDSISSMLLITFQRELFIYSHLSRSLLTCAYKTLLAEKREITAPQILRIAASSNIPEDSAQDVVRLGDAFTSLDQDSRGALDTTRIGDYTQNVLRSAHAIVQSGTHALSLTTSPLSDDTIVRINSVIKRLDSTIVGSLIPSFLSNWHISLSRFLDIFEGTAYAQLQNFVSSVDAFCVKAMMLSNNHLATVETVSGIFDNPAVSASSVVVQTNHPHKPGSPTSAPHIVTVSFPLATHILLDFHPSSSTENIGDYLHVFSKLHPNTPLYSMYGPPQLHKSVCSEWAGVPFSSASTPGMGVVGSLGSIAIGNGQPVSGAGLAVGGSGRGTSGSPGALARGGTDSGWFSELVTHAGLFSNGHVGSSGTHFNVESRKAGEWPIDVLVVPGDTVILKFFATSGHRGFGYICKAYGVDERALRSGKEYGFLSASSIPKPVPTSIHLDWLLDVEKTAALLASKWITWKIVAVMDGKPKRNHSLVTLLDNLKSGVDIMDSAERAIKEKSVLVDTLFESINSPLFTGGPVQLKSNYLSDDLSQAHLQAFRKITVMSPKNGSTNGQLAERCVFFAFIKHLGLEGVLQRYCDQDSSSSAIIPKELVDVRKCWEAWQREISAAVRLLKNADKFGEAEKLYVDVTERVKLLFEFQEMSPPPVGQSHVPEDTFKDTMTKSVSTGNAPGGLSRHHRKRWSNPALASTSFHSIANLDKVAPHFGTHNNSVFSSGGGHHHSTTHGGFKPKGHSAHFQWPLYFPSHDQRAQTILAMLQHRRFGTLMETESGGGGDTSSAWVTVGCSLISDFLKPSHSVVIDLVRNQLSDSLSRARDRLDGYKLLNDLLAHIKYGSVKFEVLHSFVQTNHVNSSFGVPSPSTGNGTVDSKQHQAQQTLFQLPAYLYNLPGAGDQLKSDIRSAFLAVYSDHILPIVSDVKCDLKLRILGCEALMLEWQLSDFSWMSHQQAFDRLLSATVHECSDYITSTLSNVPGVHDTVKVVLRKKKGLREVVKPAQTTGNPFERAVSSLVGVTKDFVPEQTTAQCTLLNVQDPRLRKSLVLHRRLMITVLKTFKHLVVQFVDKMLSAYALTSVVDRHVFSIGIVSEASTNPPSEAQRHWDMTRQTHHALVSSIFKAVGDVVAAIRQFSSNTESYLTQTTQYAKLALLVFDEVLYGLLSCLVVLVDRPHGSHMLISVSENQFSHLMDAYTYIHVSPRARILILRVMRHTCHGFVGHSSPASFSQIIRTAVRSWSSTADRAAADAGGGDIESAWFLNYFLNQIADCALPVKSLVEPSFFEGNDVFATATSDLLHLGVPSVILPSPSVSSIATSSNDQSASFTRSPTVHWEADPASPSFPELVSGNNHSELPMNTGISIVGAASAVTGTVVSPTVNSTTKVAAEPSRTPVHLEPVVTTDRPVKVTEECEFNLLGQVFGDNFVYSGYNRSRFGSELVSFVRDLLNACHRENQWHSVTSQAIQKNCADVVSCGKENAHSVLSRFVGTVAVLGGHMDVLRAGSRVAMSRKDVFNTLQLGRVTDYDGVDGYLMARIGDTEGEFDLLKGEAPPRGFVLANSVRLPVSHAFPLPDVTLRSDAIVFSQPIAEAFSYILQSPEAETLVESAFPSSSLPDAHLISSFSLMQVLVLKAIDLLIHNGAKELDPVLTQSLLKTLSTGNHNFALMKETPEIGTLEKRVNSVVEWMHDRIHLNTDPIVELNAKNKKERKPHGAAAAEKTQKAVVKSAVPASDAEVKTDEGNAASASPLVVAETFAEPELEQTEEEATVIEIMSVVPFALAPSLAGLEQRRVPTVWSPSSFINIVIADSDNLGVSYEGAAQDDDDLGCMITDNPISKDTAFYYYEVTIKNSGRGSESAIGVGFTVPSRYQCGMPGWYRGSYGYHGDDGRLHDSRHPRLEEYADLFKAGDVVGCGFIRDGMRIFFTKNGVNLGVPFQNVAAEDEEMIPVLGIHTPKAKIHANFGQSPFRFDIAGFNLKAASRLAVQMASLNVSNKVTRATSVSASKVSSKRVTHTPHRFFMADRRRVPVSTPSVQTVISVEPRPTPSHSAVASSSAEPASSSSARVLDVAVEALSAPASELAPADDEDEEAMLARAIELSKAAMTDAANGANSILGSSAANPAEAEVDDDEWEDEDDDEGEEDGDDADADADHHGNGAEDDDEYEDVEDEDDLDDKVLADDMFNTTRPGAFGDPADEDEMDDSAGFETEDETGASGGNAYPGMGDDDDEENDYDDDDDDDQNDDEDEEGGDTYDGDFIRNLYPDDGYDDDENIYSDSEGWGNMDFPTFDEMMSDRRPKRKEVVVHDLVVGQKLRLRTDVNAIRQSCVSDLQGLEAAVYRHGMVGVVCDFDVNRRMVFLRFYHEDLAIVSYAWLSLDKLNGVYQDAIDESSTYRAYSNSATVGSLDRAKANQDVDLLKFCITQKVIHSLCSTSQQQTVPVVPVLRQSVRMLLNSVYLEDCQLTMFPLFRGKMEEIRHIQDSAFDDDADKTDVPFWSGRNLPTTRRDWIPQALRDLQDVLSSGVINRLPVDLDSPTLLDVNQNIMQQLIQEAANHLTTLSETKAAIIIENQGQEEVSVQKISFPPADTANSGSADNQICFVFFDSKKLIDFTKDELTFYRDEALQVPFRSFKNGKAVSPDVKGKKKKPDTGTVKWQSFLTPVSTFWVKATKKSTTKDWGFRFCVVPAQTFLPKSERDVKSHDFTLFWWIMRTLLQKRFQPLVEDLFSAKFFESFAKYCAGLCEEFPFHAAVFSLFAKYVRAAQKFYRAMDPPVSVASVFNFSKLTPLLKELKAAKNDEDFQVVSALVELFVTVKDCQREPKVGKQLLASGSHGELLAKALSTASDGHSKSWKSLSFGSAVSNNKLEQSNQTADWMDRVHDTVDIMKALLEGTVPAVSAINRVLVSYLAKPIVVESAHPYTLERMSGDIVVENAKALTVYMDTSCYIQKHDRLLLTYKPLKNGIGGSSTFSGKFSMKPIKIADNKLTWQFNPLSQDKICHSEVRCDGCANEHLNGIRYHCLNCADFDLCASCFPSAQHLHQEEGHLFVEILRPVEIDAKKMSDLPPFKVLESNDHEAFCESCHKPVIGTALRCANCPSLFYCNACRDKTSNHNLMHIFVALPSVVDLTEYPKSVTGGILPVLYTPEQHWGFRFRVVPQVTSVPQTDNNASVIEGIANCFQSPWPADAVLELVQYCNKISESETHKRLDNLDTPPSFDFDMDLTALQSYPLLAGKSQESIACYIAILKQVNSGIIQLFRALDPLIFQRSGTIGSLLKRFKSYIFLSTKHHLMNFNLEETSVGDAKPTLRLNRQSATIGKSDEDPAHQLSTPLFMQAFAQLRDVPSSRLRVSASGQGWTVKFANEDGQDAGGLYRESITAFCAELQSNSLPLFIRCPNNLQNAGENRDKFIPNPSCTSAEYLRLYFFLGRIFGIAIRTKEALNLNLPSLVWKPLVDQPLEKSDLELIDENFVRQLHRITNEIREEDFKDYAVNFVVESSSGRQVELFEGGAHISVTWETRLKYAKMALEFRIHECDRQIHALKMGLADILMPHPLSLFLWQELELRVCGKAEFDLALLKANTEYHDLKKDSDLVRTFWQVLEGFTTEERCSFVQFTWGRSRLPASNAEWEKPFELHSYVPPGDNEDADMDKCLPQSHTCFFSLELPAYSSAEVMRERLLFAIMNCKAIIEEENMMEDDDDWPDDEDDFTDDDDEDGYIY